MSANNYRKFESLLHFVRYIVLESKNTRHHLEILSPSCSDRGIYKWIAESKDSRIITVDDHDMFPRYYFLSESLIKEMVEWLKKRNELIIPKVFIPNPSNPDQDVTILNHLEGEIKQLFSLNFNDEAADGHS